MSKVPEPTRTYSYDEKMALSTLSIPFEEIGKNEAAPHLTRAAVTFIAKGCEYLDKQDPALSEKLGQLIDVLRVGGVSLVALQASLKMAMHLRIAAEELEAYIAEMLREEYKAQNPN